MKRIMQAGWMIGRTSLSLIILSTAIIFFTFFGMKMAANWRGPDPGYHLASTLEATWDSSTAFFQKALQGDLGMTQMISGEQPINELLVNYYQNSLGLLGISLAIAAVLGILLGGFAALTAHRRWEYLILILTLLGVSAPSFFLAVLLQNLGIKYTLVFGNRLVSMGGYAWDFKHLAMPVIILTARPLAHITRVTFINLTEIMGEDYIRTAYSKGLRGYRTVIVHGLRNLAVSVLTSIGVSLRFSITILPVVEFIFAWPGLGRGALEGIRNQRPVLVVAIALAIGLTIELINSLLNGLYPWIDPRLRKEL